jgi:hypothetical protein
MPIARYVGYGGFQLTRYIWQAHREKEMRRSLIMIWLRRIGFLDFALFRRQGSANAQNLFTGTRNKETL